MRGNALIVVLALTLGMAPRGLERAPDPAKVPVFPAYIQRVQPAVVGLRVRVPANRPSALTLGAERWGSGVIFDPAGYALTVSYVLLDAGSIEVKLRDGRSVPGRMVGLDLEVGLGVEEIRRFAGYWEYMLDRAFIVFPSNPAFGGSPLVNVNGEVVGIASLRLGEPPAHNLAIPVEKFLPGKDELIQHGRVVSRRPRPWLGLYTLPGESGGVVVAGVSPVGPARQAGFQRGDVIVRLNGEGIQSQEEFYARLWASEVGREVTLVVVRDGRFEAIVVRPADRYQFFHTTGR